ncbi:isocitrate lyase/phosphoenolpyruvate mutase family protein [Microbacterium bovistercoris]|uniref:Isocitrate lyase/phosphoenolpyruvate mutase family protein n=1 Tax=Microbacterium bovistercoris TaxID=2293570 RepID=A0A371NX69_9MICO|nr:isocitrate lyase/phosphoenolpyruvate mutase family protein [Microbacterium bovistercoris]REJ07806.1 isocitrate lyase/phosphoenolpyruvate mutase family protein [Microbacterium bovistercoris]
MDFLDDDGGTATRSRALLALHEGRGFLIPNAWNAGSARILEQVGFPAIATTSAGIAWSCGMPDGGPIGPDAMFENLASIVGAVAVPVSADLEAGYGETPEDVGFTVARAAEMGLAGGNLEDAVGGNLLEAGVAAERIAAARAAAPEGTFVLNARTDTYFSSFDGDCFAETIRRASRYIDAGADCIFVPGVRDAETIRRLAAEIPVPLNMVAGLTAPVLDAPTLFSLGVKRVSVGGSIARVAFSAVERAATELFETGTLGFLDGAATYADLQRRFSG